MPDGSDALPQSPSAETAQPSPLTSPWTAQRRRLINWLKDKAPSLAELYETAVILLEQQHLPGRSRIIAHCVREIANSLPAILAGVERTRLEYDKRVDEIALARERLGRLPVQLPESMGSTSIPDPQEALIQDFLNQIDELIKEHKASQAKRDLIAEQLFQANRPENRHLGDALRPILRRWIKLKEWFVGHAHDNGKTDAEYDWNDIKGRFILFERTVLTLGQGFFETIADIDELIRTSTPADVHVVVTQLGHIEHYKYFFEHLDDPAWISALRAEGIFKNPPPIAATGIPRWAASEFLVRVAGRADPTVVISALSDIANALPQQSSVNPLIIRDLVNVLLKLPAEHSARFVQKLSKWTHQNNGVFFCRQLAKLTTHLAEGEMSREALALLAALLAIERVPAERDSEYFYKPVKPRISMYEYRHVVEDQLSPMLERNGPEVLDILCKILKKAAKLSRRSASVEEWDDNSTVWLRDLSVGDEEDHDDVRNILAMATRATAESLLRGGHVELGPLVEGLESRRWLIFRRLALYLLATTTSAPREMVALRLTHESSFRDGNLKNEYEALLHTGFVRLTPEEQGIILDWVEAGPKNVQQQIENYETTTGQRATPEDIERHRRRWQCKRLWPCHTHLPQAWRERYVVLMEEFGELEPAPPMREMREIAVGERAPRSEEDLRALTPIALREYLVNWIPDQTMFPRSTLSDLAVVVTSVVAAFPGPYADSSQLWKGLDPTYLNGIVRGFVKALQADLRFAWAPVLSLCSWALEQPRAIPERSVDRWEGDPDWGGTRWSMVELLRVGFQDETFGIPINLRDVAWHLLEILMMDPDPEGGEDEEDSEGPSHSMHRAINSIRGRAIEGLIIYYPGWIKRQTGDASLPRLPAEAQAVLDQHLDPTIDPSLAIRSLYGRWFPWILVIDQDWATAAVPRIFPDAAPQYWLAAWNGFICFNTAYEQVFEPLQAVYAKAISQLGRQADQSDDTRQLRDERLAGHLMNFYWQGRYPLDHQDGLVRQFFSQAPDKVRAEAIEFIGRSLDRTNGPVEPVVLDRLQRLWVWRLEQARRDPAASQTELKAFGWCFGSSKFEARWAIENLLDVLRLTNSIDPDFQVLERLPDYAAGFPIEVLECVRLLIEGETSNIELSGWDDDLRRILSQIKEHLVAEVRQASDAVIELLGRLGYLGYVDLLSINPESS